MSLWSLSLTRQPEMMDDPALSPEEHLRALAALARINALSRTAAQIAAAIGRRFAAGMSGPGPCVVVDVACGGGDVTVELAARLARVTPPGSVRVVGVDISRRAVQRSAALAARAAEGVSFAVRDVIAEGCPPCDIAVSSLFLHHLDDDAARGLLAAMAAAARCGIVVSDLVRSRVGLAMATFGTAVLTRSLVARVDGPASVRAARTRAEYRSLCDAAGLRGADIRRAWPERALVSWWRAGANAIGAAP